MRVVFSTVGTAARICDFAHVLRTSRYLRNAYLTLLARYHIYTSMGKPKKGRPRETARRLRANLPVRLSQLERALIDAAADQVGETLTGFIRRASVERAIGLTRQGGDDDDAEDDTESRA